MITIECKSNFSKADFSDHNLGYWHGKAPNINISFAKKSKLSQQKQRG